MDNNDITFALESTSPGSLLAELKSYLNSGFHNPDIVNIFTPIDSRGPVKTLSDLHMGTLSKYQVYAPIIMSGSLLDHLSTLETALSELSTIELRILKPIRTWAGNMIVDTESASKIWPGAHLKTVNIKQITDSWPHTDIYQQDTDGVLRSIQKVYTQAVDLELASNVLNRLNTNAVSDEITNLSKDIRNTMEVFERLKNDKEAIARIQSVDPKAKDKVKTLLHHAASEVSLLSVVLFQIQVATTLHRASLEKIKKDLM